MALTDYERAWRDLEEYVSSKPHHGSKDLALQMQRCKAQSALDETLIERVFRVHGVLISQDLRANARDQLPDVAGGSSAGDDTTGPDHRQHDTTEEVNDGIRNGTGARAL